MAAKIAYINFMDESGRIIELSAPEKEKWTKKIGKWIGEIFLGSFVLIGIGIVIGMGGSTGGYVVKKISIQTLDQNRMS